MAHWGQMKVNCFSCFPLSYLSLTYVDIDDIIDILLGQTYMLLVINKKLCAPCCLHAVNTTWLRQNQALASKRGAASSPTLVAQPTMAHVGDEPRSPILLTERPGRRSARR